MIVKNNKFLANLTNDYNMYEFLSIEYNIKESEIIQIDLISWRTYVFWL